jgi:hypothetical protein
MYPRGAGALVKLDSRPPWPAAVTALDQGRRADIRTRSLETVW